MATQRTRLGFWLGLSLLLPWQQAQANCVEPQGEALRFGMSTALSGPAQYIGRSMEHGVRALFAQVNCLGGLRGAPLVLLVRDDGYQPDSALANVKKLIHDDNVLAMIGNVGTPTAKLTAPYANQYQRVLFAPYTGAAILRKQPPDDYIFNFRASYFEEMQAIVNDIVRRGIKPARIAFLLQDDAYGQAGYQAAIRVLESKGFRFSDELQVSKYPRNSLQVDNAIIEMLDLSKPPGAIIIVGAYAAAARFINHSHNLLPDTLYYNLSFTGATALGQNLTVSSDRVLISQVVPQIQQNPDLQRAFKAGLALLPESTEANEISYEGYLAARLLVHALGQYSGPLDSEGIQQALANMPDLAMGLGTAMTLSSKDHQASHQVWLLQYQQGKGFVNQLEVQ